MYIFTNNAKSLPATYFMSGVRMAELLQKMQFP